jgi:nucleotidyltransferase substrate binding protein (TIGR01987 family)
MENINTDYFNRCIHTLEQAFQALNKQPSESILYDIYRAACIKEFEIILEQTGKLLKKKLKPYFSSSKQADMLNFKDIFRYVAKYGLINLEETERWLIYQDHRNETAHDYGVNFANSILVLLPQFIIDAYRINNIIRNNDL